MQCYFLGKYDDFQLVDNLLDIPWEDMVSFYIGCSLSFDLALQLGGLPLHHAAMKQDPPVYFVDIPCHPVGSFSGNMLVSMRAFPRDLVQRAVEVTAPLEFCHGAPIHVGDPGLIGIKNFFKEDDGGPPVIYENEVPVFWGCGMTEMEAMKSASMLSLLTARELAEPSWDGQGWAGQGWAGQSRAGQGRAGQGRAGQGRAGQSLNVSFSIPWGLFTLKFS